MFTCIDLIVIIDIESVFESITIIINIYCIIRRTIMDIIKEIKRLPNYLYALDTTPYWVILGGNGSIRGIYNQHADYSCSYLIEYHDELYNLFQDKNQFADNKQRVSYIQNRILTRCYEQRLKKRFTIEEQDNFLRQLPQVEKYRIEKQILMYKQAREF